MEKGTKASSLLLSLPSNSSGETQMKQSIDPRPQRQQPAIAPAQSSMLSSTDSEHPPRIDVLGLRVDAIEVGCLVFSRV